MIKTGYNSKSQVRRIAAQQGKCSMCGENHAEATARDNAARTIAVERCRLEQKVIEAAGLLRRLAAVHARYVAPSAIAEAATRYREAESRLFVAVDALTIFKAQQKDQK